jgi:hypothetical protein
MWTEEGFCGEMQGGLSVSVTPEEAISLKEEFTALANDIRTYFESLAGLKDKAELAMKKSGKVTPEPYLRTIEEKAAAKQLSQRIIDFGNRLLPAIQASPLLDSADETSVITAIRGMNEAVNLQWWFRDEDLKRWDVSDVMDIEQAKKSAMYHQAQVLHFLPLLAPASQEQSAALVSRRMPQVQRYRPNTAFIMMRIDPGDGATLDVKEAVKEVFREFGIFAQRSDEIEHSDSITQRILDEIETSEFLFADLSGERPSVYYEVGYAHALGKRVIMYREQRTRLHFDLSVHNVKEYSSLTQLKAELRNRLEAVTGRKPERGQQG